FCVAIGILASVIHHEGGQAQASAVAVAAVLCLAAPIARWIKAFVVGTGGLRQEWLVSSPAYPGYLAVTDFAGGSPRLFWTASGITLCYSLTALLLAAVILQRTWREEPATLAPPKLRELWQAWNSWGKSSRRRLRMRLLRQNPFSWLAA